MRVPTSLLTSRILLRQRIAVSRRARLVQHRIVARARRTLAHSIRQPLHDPHLLLRQQTRLGHRDVREASLAHAQFERRCRLSRKSSSISSWARFPRRAALRTVRATYVSRLDGPCLTTNGRQCWRLIDTMCHLLRFADTTTIAPHQPLCTTTIGGLNGSRGRHVPAATQ